jgi:hypothetical protein
MKLAACSRPSHNQLTKENTFPTVSIIACEFWDLVAFSCLSSVPHNAPRRLDALMASRGSSGVLESTSPTILNALSGALPPLKKRKIAHVESETSPTSIISIKVWSL